MMSFAETINCLIKHLKQEEKRNTGMSANKGKFTEKRRTRQFKRKILDIRMHTLFTQRDYRHR